MKNLRTDPDRPLPELPPSYDRRRRDRVGLAIPLRIMSYGLLAQRIDSGVCTDLSEGGVSFDSEAELNVGDMIVLEFSQRGEAAYRCRARLAYRMGRRYGAYFIAGE